MSSAFFLDFLPSHTFEEKSLFINYEKNYFITFVSNF